MITEEEKKAINDFKELQKKEALEVFLKNEEKLWDLAALTIAPTIYQMMNPNPNTLFNCSDLMQDIAVESYKMADALMTERRKRLTEKPKDIQS